MKREYDLHQVMEKNLSGLRMTDAHKAAIRERARGGEKMKKKMPLALVLALILALVSVTALAFSNWEAIKDYLKTVRFLTYEVIEWTLEDKMELVEAMQKADLIEDQSAYERLANDTLNDAEKEAICDAIIEARYGEDWQYSGSIESIEWPEEMRRQSEETMREYDMWSDQVDEAWAEVNPYKVEIREGAITEEELMQLFLDKLETEYGVEKSSILPGQITLKCFQEDEVYLLTYTITHENPGKYDPTLHVKPAYYSQPRNIGGDLMEDDPAPMTMLERMALLQDASDSYTFMWVTDLSGNEQSFLPWSMEKEMIRNLSSRLTEIENFEYGSFDPSMFEVWFDEELQLWVASYTITTDNPGIAGRTMDEIEYGEPQITMMEYMEKQEGKKDSYTFYCYYDSFDRIVFNEDVGKPREKRANYVPPVTGKQAEDAARRALDEKYPITLAELEELRTSTALYQEMDGSLEYYIEFIGYEYSEQLARVWSYAARVNPENGEVLAAIKRDEWNQLTGRKLVADASPEMEKLIWENDMQDALRRAAGDESGNGWNLNVNKKGEYFYAWTLEEKAAYTEKYKPLIDQFLAENVEYAQMLQDRYDAGQDGFPDYYNTTRHAYGLPDEKSISQEKARKIGYQAILETLNAPKDILDQAWAINVYYDVTDSEKPLWKFFYNTIADDTGPDEAWGYFVSINAYTGEIEACYERWAGTPMIDLM